MRITFRLYGFAAAMLVAQGCASDPSETEGGKHADIGVRYGVDYSWARPALSTLSADGYTFVSRYLSHDTTGKNISAGEAAALRAAGFSITLNWEQNTTAPLDGYSRGAADAQAAALEAISVGAPGDIPIYFSVDFDAQPAQQGVIDAYFDGVASVIGRSRTGAYGGYYLIGRLFDDGRITYGWQTYAWSYGHWDPRAQVRQIQNGILGGQADLDMAVADNFGQWGFVDSGPPPAPPPLPTACGYIEPGHGLANGQGWASCDGRFWLAMQTDGNLVLYSSGVPTWTTSTGNGAIAVMQGDGNFVEYSDHSHPLFNSGTYGSPGATLAIQDDGNLVVYNTGGTPLWWTGTGGMPAPPDRCGAIVPGRGLAIGEGIASCSGQYVLVQQGDGNLVLYHGGTAIWANNQVGSGARMAVMQGDGNFVTYSAGGAVWETGTGYAGGWLAVQDDGNLVVYVGSTPVWASGTAGR